MSHQQTPQPNWDKQGTLGITGRLSLKSCDFDPEPKHVLKATVYLVDELGVVWDASYPHMMYEIHPEVESLPRNISAYYWIEPVERSYYTDRVAVKANSYDEAVVLFGKEYPYLTRGGVKLVKVTSPNGKPWNAKHILPKEQQT